jgi:transposase
MKAAQKMVDLKPNLPSYARARPKPRRRGLRTREADLRSEHVHVPRDGCKRRWGRRVASPLGRGTTERWAAKGRRRRDRSRSARRPRARADPGSTITCACGASVEYDGHYYSIDHTKKDETYEIRATSTTIEIFLRGLRVDAYPRSYERGRHTTRPEHMPKAHRAHAEWSPSRLIKWAKTIGVGTAALVEAIIAEKRHPEQGYRSCLGILRLSKKYGPDRLEAACARAVAVGARSYRHVDAILKSGLDRVALPTTDSPPVNGTSHENVRGRDYYH